MKLSRQSRRMFLQGAGGALLAVPFLRSLWPAEAQAQSVQVARRFIAVKSYSTQYIHSWYPRFSGNGYTARPYQRNTPKEDGTTVLTESLSTATGRRSNGREYFAKYAPLSDLIAGGSLSTILGERLNPFVDKMLMLRGLDFMPDTNHNEGGMLGNYAAADANPPVEPWATIDQVLAQSPKVYPTAPSGPRILHLSPSRNNTFSFVDDGGSITQATAHVDPRTAFDEAFANFVPGSEPVGPDPNKKLVDRVLEDYRSVANGPRLSAADKQTLNRHMTFLSELEGKLGGGGSRVACAEPVRPDSVTANGVDPGTLSTIFDRMVDVAVAAIQCDVTRIVTLNVWKGVARGVGSGGADLGYVHSGLRDAQDWHERAHEWGNEDSDRQVVAINQWIANEIFARLLEGLDVDEGDGATFLDNSIVFWGNELGMNHLNWSVPALLVGSGGGVLSTGRFIDYIDWDANSKFTQEDGPVIEGTPHNRLLVTLLQAFGLEPGEYERNGQPGYGSYSTWGKDQNLHAIDYDASQYGNPLPGLLAG